MRQPRTTNRRFRSIEEVEDYLRKKFTVVSISVTSQPLGNDWDDIEYTFHVGSLEFTGDMLFRTGVFKECGGKYPEKGAGLDLYCPKLIERR